MAAEDKNRSEALSRIVAELSVKAKAGEDLSSKIRHLRDELKKVIEHEETIFGKFRVLVESFREIIPDEKQRYLAAIKALTATSKLSRQEIVQAVNNQLAELKILEKGLISALPGWRDELKAMEARSRETRDELTKLRERIGALESEDKTIRADMAAREKEMELVEKAVGKLFTDMGAEITSIKNKVNELTAESAPPQQIWPGEAPRSEVAGKAAATAAPAAEGPGPSADQERQRQWQKKCPMCGGRMDFNEPEKMWKCYSCAYEEEVKAQAAGDREYEIPETAAPTDSEWQRKCPMCGGHLNYHSQENLWQCYTCAFEESGKGEVRDAGESKSVPDTELFDIPMPDQSIEEYQESKKTSPQFARQPSTKKKPCPVCHKKMNWHPKEGAWQCPYCNYERRI